MRKTKSKSMPTKENNKYTLHSTDYLVSVLGAISLFPNTTLNGNDSVFDF